MGPRPAPRLSATLAPLAAAAWLCASSAAARAADAAAAGPAGGDGAQAPPAWMQFAPMAAIVALFYFLLIAPQQRRQQRRQQMLAAIKENDHVVTSAGIHGVVTGVQRDVDNGRVTLRVDDATGTKLRVAMWAIESVLGDPSTESTTKK